MKKIPKWMYHTPIAHRGYFEDDAPENSLIAFKKAIDRGFAIELDVQLLKDDTILVFHDKNFERMTGYKDLLANTIYNDIKELTLKSTGEKIPTFKEVLEYVDGQVPLMIEFKNESKNTKLEDLSYQLLKEYTGPFVVQSFSPWSVKWFKDHAPHIVRGQLSSRFKENKMSALTKLILRNVYTNVVTKPDYVIYKLDALETHVIKRLKKKGMPIFSYTAKSKEDYTYARNMNAPACFEGFDPQA